MKQLELLFISCQTICGYDGICPLKTLCGHDCGSNISRRAFGIKPLELSIFVGLSCMKQKSPNSGSMFHLNHGLRAPSFCLAPLYCTSIPLVNSQFPLSSEAGERTSSETWKWLWDSHCIWRLLNESSEFWRQIMTHSCRSNAVSASKPWLCACSWLTAGHTR